MPVNILCPVQPGEEISRYTVFQHAHPGHQVYEVGHEISLVGYCYGQQEALKFWDELLPIYSKMSDRGKPDLTLIAELKGQKPVLDMEGIPVANTAILLKTACPNFDIDQGKKVYKLDEWMDMNAMFIKQPALAHFNPDTNNIDFFNHQLNKVSVNSRLEYMDLTFFCTKKWNVSPSLKENMLQNISDTLKEVSKTNYKLNKGL
jgi:hypothetical protein